MKRMLKILIIAAVLMTLMIIAGCGRGGAGDNAVSSAQPTALATEQTAYNSPGASEAAASEAPSETAEPTQAPDEKPVVFTNALFENAVRQELGVYGETPLYPSRLARVESLDLSGKMLSEINDIAWFTGLRGLDLSGNPDVTYIEYVGRLENLRNLNLNATGVSDLGALANLKELRVLKLVGIPAKELGPLAGLPELEELVFDAYDSEALDISPLSGLVNLKKLEVTTDDLTPLAGLNELITLNVCGGFGDLDALSGLTKLEVLHVRGDYGPLDISGLAPLTELRQLMIQLADVGSLEPLAGMSSLFLLSLNKVNIDGIAPLAKLKGCTDMFLTNCGIDDVTPLYSLTGLKELELSYNPLTYDQIAELRKHLPNCSISFVRSDG